MRLTSKGRYAVTAMLDIAIHQPLGAVSLSDIATRQCISLSYLEQIFTRLRKAKLVKSVRGPGGGYLIGAPLTDISVQSIVSAMNEDLDARQCHGSEDCHDGKACLSHALWDDLSSMIEQFLSGITLATLLEKRQMSLNTQQEISVSQILRR
jgi:Rrf2 family transcriptional regulator, iron-sulfur cluster assembly transcription factor